MKFSVNIESIQEKQNNQCIVVWVSEPNHLSSTAEIINKKSHGYISTLLRQGEIEGKLAQTLLLYHIPNIFFERILLVGCGKEFILDEYQYKKIIQKIINTLNKTSITEITCFLSELHIKNRNTYWKVRQAIEIIKEATYSFDEMKTNKITSNRSLHKITFTVSTLQEIKIGKHAIQHGLAISSGIKLAKDLGNMPPNICNSSYLLYRTNQLADRYSQNITICIIGEKQMEKLGMNAYLAVGKGSKNESLMIIINYKGNPKTTARPIVLIGKGLTFDSGGISIKSAENMDEMKYDMCGAASIYGVIHTIAELNLPLNVIGVLSCCENMISNQAFRPSDVLKTMSGKTVEVLNTDAEGRLVLCDTLTYVERFDPDVVIDVATLTGACVVALGHHISGLLSNYDPLVQELLTASEQSGDRVWHLPMTHEYQEQLESTFADIANIGNRSGGAITAACFLSQFAKKYNWAHLDIAGTAWSTEKIKGATGRPVALLSQFLLNRIGKI